MKESLDSNPSPRAGLYAQNRLNKAIRTGRASAALVALIGCTLPFFLAHLESLCVPGQSLANYGRGPGTWQVDHVVPRSAWGDLRDETQAKAAFHWQNLQPLWAIENMKKGRRLKRVNGELHPPARTERYSDVDVPGTRNPLVSAEQLGSALAED